MSEGGTHGRFEAEQSERKCRRATGTPIESDETTWRRFAAAASGTVDVGADGVSIRRWGKTRFIRADAIDAVTPYARRKERVTGAMIRLKSGEEVVLLFGGAAFERGELDKNVAAFVERVEEAMRVYRGGGALESAMALLDRGSRDVADWVKGLRALGAGASATLRSAAIGPEQLLRIFESAAARPIDRAAAAVAIESSSDDDAKARVRVAAAVVADVRLRAALDAAADGDLERIEATLGALTSR